MTFSAKDLQQAYKELPELPDDVKLSFWGKQRMALRNKVLSGADPDILLQWPTVVGTMVVGDTDQLKKKIDIVGDEWKRYGTIKEKFVCGAQQSGYTQLPISGNYINQIYHMARFERIAGRTIDSFDTIVEFGGGYGAMAAIVRQLGFSGDYYIYDLAEVSLLQRYYLGKIGVEACCVSSVDELPSKPDLFIAIHSLSESPIDIRHSFFEHVKPSSFFLAYKGKWFDIDNGAYFKDFMRDFRRDWRIYGAVNGSIVIGLENAEK